MFWRTSYAPQWTSHKHKENFQQIPLVDFMENKTRQSYYQKLLIHS